MSNYLLAMNSVLTVLSLMLWLHPIPHMYANEPVEDTGETNYKPDTFNDIANHSLPPCNQLDGWK